MGDLRAPFPWFGGKSKVADLVWDRFGNVVNYVEPFFGSGAVLLGRPHPPTIETVNDIDCLLVNFWRATQYAPEEVAKHADWPVHETEMHAWHVELVKQKARVREALEADPRWFDAELAGKWVWGLCAWIGSGWCSGKESKQVPYLSSSGTPGHGQGINAKHMRLPALGAGSGGQDDHPCAHYGKGVHSQGMRLSRQLPDIGARAEGIDGGRGVHSGTNRTHLYDVFRALSERLRHVRVTCGPADRILTPAVTWRHGTTGVFLDPPYPADAGSTGGIYTTTSEERAAFDGAFRYCIENGHDKRLRIALCYYESTTVRHGLDVEGPAEDVSHALRSLGWDIVSWKAGGGYGGQSGKNENAARERVAFSPGCLRAKQGSLFE
jgi:DNA adenine methylase